MQCSHGTAGPAGTLCMYMHILTLWFGYTLVDYSIAISRENAVMYPKPDTGAARL